MTTEITRRDLLLICAMLDFDYAELVAALTAMVSTQRDRAYTGLLLKASRQ